MASSSASMLFRLAAGLATVDIALRASSSNKDSCSISKEGAVKIWLNKTSVTKLKANLLNHIPTDMNILLESKDYVGSKVYEPLYGVNTSCKVLGVASSDETIAVIIQVTMSGGEILPLGQSVAILGSNEKGMKLADTLFKLGVISKGKNWCGMIKNENLRNELIEYDTSYNSIDDLEGIVCTTNDYISQKHACSWSPSLSQQPKSLKNKHAQSSVKKADIIDECPLCKFIKDGGCNMDAFQECVELATKEEMEANQNKSKGNKRVCLHLFDPVKECMQSTQEKKLYYKAFIQDFSHLFVK